MPDDTDFNLPPTRTLPPEVRARLQERTTRAIDAHSKRRTTRLTIAAAAVVALAASTTAVVANQLGDGGSGPAGHSLAIQQDDATNQCSTSPEPKLDNGRITVATSPNVWGSIVSAVGGDRVQVIPIIDNPAADPHTCVVSNAQAAAIAGADIVILNGGGYEQTVRDIVDRGIDGQLFDVFASTGRPLTDAEYDWTRDVTHEIAAEIHVMNTTRDMLVSLDPDNEDYYQANRMTFARAADGMLLRYIGPIQDRHGGYMTGLPGASKGQDEFSDPRMPPGKPIASTEPYAAYPFSHIGLQDRTPPAYSDAIEAGTEPPENSLREFRRLLSEGDVAALVYNPQRITTTTADLLDTARASGVRLIEMTALIPPGSDYLTWMSSNLEALDKGLS